MQLLICDVQQKKCCVGELWCGSPLFDSVGQRLSLATEESREVHASDDAVLTVLVLSLLLSMSVLTSTC